MKSFLPLMLFFGISGVAWGQNQIIAPAGQSIRIATDTMVITAPLKIAKTLTLGTYRFIGIQKTTAGELNTFVGPNSGNLTTTGRWNTFMGENSGLANTTGRNNAFIGTFSGGVNSTATGGTFVGYKSGNASTTGNYNVIVGNTAGALNTSGESNVFLGLDAGWSNQTGGSNVAIGRAAGTYNVAGSNNTFIGSGAGFNSLGSGNVFIGRSSGFNETGSNKFYIGNHSSNLPLVQGDFPTSPTTGGKFIINGKVGMSVNTFPTSAIDSTNTSVPTSSFQLFVNGGMLSKALTVNATWADFVFEENYRLKSLLEVEAFIEKNGHLSGVPSAKEIATKGLDLGELSKVQQEKIEELTLYLINQKKQIQAQHEMIMKQMAQIEKVNAVLDEK
ncbi:hypothetical protein LZD49_26465 [Dyadobacter sp. CY261]|uniref:hypothetical protein n=1 Tax=Dyadobacter sp. CY261 TaxID=2907203 RepID=UPI001F1A23BB|nr:hypothetical protein [Dyadobacter sp. CY261]MCF0074054.1 hypothetical protein [Dyadobacter sp. CY261]